MIFLFPLQLLLDKGAVPPPGYSVLNEHGDKPVAVPTDWLITVINSKSVRRKRISGGKLEAKPSERTKMLAIVKKLADGFFSANELSDFKGSSSMTGNPLFEAIRG